MMHLDGGYAATSSPAERAICRGSSLRRHLLSKGQLPARPIVWPLQNGQLGKLLQAGERSAVTRCRLTKENVLTWTFIEKRTENVMSTL